MNKHKLKRLLQRDEGFKLDYKLKLSLELDSEKKEFVKDVIAIANTPGGRGHIIFGIEDGTRSIVGIENIPEHIEERMQQIIANRSMPPVPIRFEIVPYEDKEIGVLTIFRSMQVPHQMLQSGAFYIRRGSTTDKAMRHEIAMMLQQFGMLSFENVPCRASRFEDLDEQLLRKYMGHLLEGENISKALLVTLGILATDLEKEVYYPTYGGLLLFGKSPQNFIPQAVLELESEEGIEGIMGNIPYILEHFEMRAEKLLPVNYPLIGLIEVVTNALIHRNYWNNTDYIRVQISEDKVSVYNPLSYEGGATKGFMGRVNPWLYGRLLLIAQKEDSFHLGIGLEKTKALFERHGSVIIKSHQLEGIFEVTLPGTAVYEEE